MKILITGAKGQLGYKIGQVLRNKHELIKTDSDNMDVTSIYSVNKNVNFFKPDIILHCAAYTKVDQAEDEEKLCRAINVTGSYNIATVASKTNIPVFYISTDFVFDGSKKIPYTEKDDAKPLSIYGVTKFEGEKAIRNICPKHYIIRVAWLFGELPEGYKGSNFVETMLRLASEHEDLSVVNDQIGSPTYTKDLVKLIDHLIENKPAFGTYHFSGEGETSWYGFAKKIFEQTKTNIHLKPISSKDYPSKAMRPKYSYLSKNKVKNIGFQVRSWQEMLLEYLNNRS